jgi:hypothetical protein
MRKKANKFSSAYHLVLKFIYLKLNQEQTYICIWIDYKEEDVIKKLCLSL